MGNATTTKTPMRAPLRKPTRKPAAASIPPAEGGFWGRNPLEKGRLALQYELAPLKDLRPWAENPRQNDHAVPKLMKLIEAHGFAGVIVATPDGVIRAGHTRYKAVQKLGWTEIPVEWKNFPSKEAAEEYALADNKSAEWTDWDHELLGKLFKRRREVDIDALVANTGFSPNQIKFVGEKGGWTAGSLRERFGAPPFTVLNAMTGDWPERKRKWAALGIQSELGRDAGAYANLALPERRGGSMSEISIFDPVLTEIMYTWFCPRGGQILDPFAGGSVRGVVAGALGYQYWGCDLSADQVAANEKQRAEFWAGPLKGRPSPVWRTGDSSAIVPKHAPHADLLFSCPPYGNLEVYSKAAQDLSNMAWADFRQAYRYIIRASLERLAPNRFAVFVVATYRDGPKGFLRDLPGETVVAFEAGGAQLYNEAVFLHPLGTLPVRVPRIFESGRKLGKAHQNVMIFCKGDPKLATAAIRAKEGPSRP